MYGITWFELSRSHIAAMSPVEMNEVGSLLSGACHTVVSSVFGRQFVSSVRSSGSFQDRSARAARPASTAGLSNVRADFGGRRDGSGRDGGAGDGPGWPWVQTVGEHVQVAKRRRTTRRGRRSMCTKLRSTGALRASKDQDPRVRCYSHTDSKVTDSV